MKVSVVGTGYVGLVSGTCFSEIGHHVTCIDIDQNKINQLKKGESPIYEPGLSDLLKRNIKAKRLDFTTSFTGLKDSPVVFLAVGTPSNDDGSANLEYLYQAGQAVAENMGENTLVVIKSTVPVGTANNLREFIQSKTSTSFSMVNNPEFLKEGSAIDDFMKPDRVVVGFCEPEVGPIMDELYAPLVRQGNPIYKMSNLSAEMTKYAANSFLATKISFINEVAKLCDKVGADISEVRQGMTSDRRIGKHFLYPGPGYGGSCFPKDVQAMMKTATDAGEPLKIIEAAHAVNLKQKLYVFNKIKKHFQENLKGLRFAFWGVAFKPNTDDVREAPALEIAQALCQEGAKINFFDPIAAKNFKQALGGLEEKVESFENKYDCLANCDALVVLTEWSEFRAPNFQEIKKHLKKPVLFDARNLYDTQAVLEAGFSYYAVGKKI